MTVNCLLQVNNGSWCQESYETASRDAGRGAYQLRKLGYLVAVSTMGSQITRYGQLRLPMGTIWPGTIHNSTASLPATTH